MPIKEINNPKRKRNGEEIFELITQRPVRSELGNAYEAILRIAYDYSFRENPFFQAPATDSITNTAIILLTVCHYLLENRRRPDLKQEYRLTEKGKRVYELLFP